MSATSQQQPLILVDGSSYLYRAFHGMPNFSNSRGIPTGAVYGVVNMLRSLIKQYNPTHIGMIFDAKGKTFRDDLFTEYKANRPPMPDELRQQIEPLYQIIEAMGLPLISIPGVEADDVIGTLAQQAAKAGHQVLISTGDKDIAQLVTDKITLINTMNNQLLDPQGVIDKFGVTAEQIIDYLALMGDTSDNIPGIPKVGPKTAVKWLTQYGTLDEIVAHADEIKGKVGENLRDNLEQLNLSRELTTIKCDVKDDALTTEIDDLKPSKSDTEQLKQMFAEYEFKTWLRELLEDNHSTTAPELISTTEEPTYETITEQAQLDEWLEKLRNSELFAFDTETTSLNYMDALIVGLSFAVKRGHAAYLPLAHNYPGAPDQLDRNTVLTQFKPLLEDPNQLKVGQNLKYDRSVLANHKIDLQGIAHDTMLESYVLDSTATRHNMDALALKYLGRKTTKYEEVAGKGAKQIPFNQVSIEVATPYAAEDAEVTLALHETLLPQLEERGLLKLYSKMEMPLLSILSNIERTGVLIDSPMLQQQSQEIAQKLVEIEKAAYEEAGENFNLSSPKQIQTILFEKLELPILKKTPKGQPSTAEEVLQELALDYPLPELILKYRSLAKLKSTYTDKLPQMVNMDSGRIHTSYHQAVAATGRLSSSDPNLQNIPIRSAEGRRIRQAFIAPEGSVILAADYSQVELRIMAHLSGDKGLLKAFSAGEDIHRATAAEVFGIPVDEVTSDQRRSAKAINFGLIYGMSAFGLAKQLSIGRAEAQNYIDLYFARSPGVKNYMEETKEQAKTQGYVETLFGRRLYLPDINSSNGQRRQYAERTAINAPMQGTAADIIKRAMLAVAQWLQNGTDDAQGVKMIMQVHDELVFEVKQDQVEGARKQIIELMESAADLSVPLLVEADVGDNWDEAH